MGPDWHYGRVSGGTVRHCSLGADALCGSAEDGTLCALAIAGAVISVVSAYFTVYIYGELVVLYALVVLPTRCSGAVR